MYTIDRMKSPNYKKYAKSNLPIKYIDSDINDFRIIGDTKQEKLHNEKMFGKFMDFYENIEENLKQGRGLVLCGSVGIAKTWLMTHLAKKAIDIFTKENERQQEENNGNILKVNHFYYIQATTINQMIFPTGLNQDELNIRRGIKTIAGLFIDDISKMSETKGGYEIAFLDDLLRWRDLNCLSTFYTSQIPFDSIDDFDGLDKALSKPIHDIIRGNCDIITFRGESQR